MGQCINGGFPVRLILSALVCVALSLPALAQSAQRVVVVKEPGAAARAGPSDSFPDTGIIPAGTRVVVTGEEGDWLAIEPPVGQRSWVPALWLIDPDARPSEPGFPDPRGGAWDAVIAPDGPVEINVLAGDPTRPRPLAVRRVKVPAGTVVRVTGPAVEHERAKWYPVEPPPGDLRYLPKGAVLATALPAPTFTVRSPPNSGAKTTPAATPSEPVSANTSAYSNAGDLPPVPPNAPTGEALWAEAEAATRARDYRHAEGLYLRLGVQMNHADRRDEAAACYARLHQVRTLAVTATPAAPATRPGAWHGPGRLREAPFRIGERDAYAVQGADGKTLCYVVADSGVELARFTGFQVELYGPSTLRGDLNGVPLVSASRIQQARQ